MDQAKRTVLVVDDDTVLVKLICKHFERSGYQTFAASNGEEAFAIFQKEHPSAVVTDYSMPKMNGERLVECIREVDQMVPVLLITGDLSDAVILDFLRFDRIVAIHKPFKPDEILSSLEHVMSLSSFEENTHGRQATRFNLEVPLSLGRYDKAKSINISAHGMFIETDQNISKGEKITIVFDLPIQIQVAGEVMWKREPDAERKITGGVGIRFTEFKGNAESGIRNLLVNELKKMGRGWITFSSR